jgi:amidohydrolase
MSDAVAALLPGLTEFYRDLHRHPELSGAEARTAGAFAQHLTGSGFEVTTGIGGHGVVGLLPNGSGPTVAIRADMDALPLTEATGLEYASETDGVMHACGHDVHVACAAGAARILAESRERWQGTVIVVGQPAEETLDGAAAMLTDGLYDRFGRPDVVLGQHVAPLPAGMLAHGHGLLMAGTAELEVVVHGRGGHGAAPHLAVDPVVLAASIVLRLQTIVSRQANPLEPLVLTVGSLRAGTRSNVIPGEARMNISIRAFSDDLLDRTVAAVERIVRGECSAVDCPQPPEILTTSRAPVNVNDPAAAARVRIAHEGEFGKQRVIDWPPSMASEDFPLFGAAGAKLYGGPAVPTVYWFTGSTGQSTWVSAAGVTPFEKLGTLPPNHSPEFAPEPVATIHAGVRAMVAAVFAYLAAPIGHTTP